MNVRNEIKAQIIRTGMTMQEVVDLLSQEYGWSDSVSNLSAKLQRESIRYKEVLELADVLGLLYERKEEASLDDEIEALIAKRTEARKNKDWATADAIRDELKARHVILEDTPQGIKWHIEA